MDEMNEKRNGEETGMSGPSVPQETEPVSGADRMRDNGPEFVAQPTTADGEQTVGAQPVPEAAPAEGTPERAGETAEQTPGAQPAGQPENAAFWDALQEPKPQDKKNKWILAGVAAGILVLAIVIIALAGSVLLQSDQKRFIAAFVKSEFSQPKAGEDVFGLEEMMEAAQETSYVYGGALQLDGSNMSEMDQYRSMGLTAELGMSNTPAREMAMKLMVKYGGMDVAGLLYYVDPQKLEVGIPGLTDKVLTLDYQEGFEQRLEDSYMGQNGMDEDDIQYLSDLMTTLREIMNNPAAAQNLDAQELAERISTAIDVKNRLEKEMEVEREGSKSFVVNGKSVSCTGYRAVIRHDTWMALLEELEQFILEDEQLKLIVYNYINQFQITMDDDELRMDSVDDLEFSLDILLNRLDDAMEDIELTGYIDRSGHMVSLTIRMAYEDEYGDTMEFNEEILWKGGAYMAQNMEVTVAVSDDYNDAEISITQNGKTEGDISSHDYKATVKMNGTKVLTGTFGTDFDQETKEASLDAMVRLDSMMAVSLDLKAEGVFDQVEKGKSMHFTLDTMTLRAAGMTMNFSGEFYVEPTDTLERPEGEVFDLLTTDEDIWYDFADEIYDNIYNITRQFDNSGFD